MKKTAYINTLTTLALLYSTSSSAAYITEISAPNNSFTDAQFIADSAFTIKYDKDIDAFVNSFRTTNISTTFSHASVLGTGDTSVDYFSFQATQGTLYLDIDNGIDSGGSFDSWLELYDSSFNLISSNDDARQDSGSQFSFNNAGRFSFDSFINYQVTLDDIYYVVVGGNANPAGIPDGSNYTLHISNNSTVTPPPTSTVPLPASIWLLISGLVGLISVGRKK